MEKIGGPVLPERLGDVCPVPRGCQIRLRSDWGKSPPRSWPELELDFRKSASPRLRAPRIMQDVVYREPSPPKLGQGEPSPLADWEESVAPDPSPLFCYFAVTLNAHRIYFDWPC
ncbi:hypothetical protein D9M68_392810 [compost metagenome]